MNEILEYLITKDKILTIFTIIFTVVYVFAATLVIRKVKERRIIRKNTFMETFIKGISENTIENLDDLLNIYSGVTQLSTEDLTNKQSLNKWLREILAKLVNHDFAEQIDAGNIVNIKYKITNFIKINEKASPFSDLPSTERNILNDINAFNKINDHESIARKLNELSSVIITRNEQQQKIENVNKWSIPLAVIGLLLTIIFGISSIL